MGFVIVGFLGLALVIGLVWLAGFLFLSTKERIRCERERHEAEREALLQTPGEPLRCHGCGNVFEGPISGLGCETCHTSALVIPECQSRDSKARMQKTGILR